MSDELRTAADKSKVLAEFFHNTYERLAPSFGYETRPDTKTFDAESANGRLMIAVCAEVVRVIDTALAATTPARAALAPSSASTERVTSFQFVARAMELSSLHAADVAQNNTSGRYANDLRDWLNAFAQPSSAPEQAEPATANALMYLTEAVMTRADRDYMDRQLQRAVIALRVAKPGWSPPIPWPELEPELRATHPEPVADSVEAVSETPDERSIRELIEQRDHREAVIDDLCDAVLGKQRPEWSSAYDFADAVNDVMERMAWIAPGTTLRAAITRIAASEGRKVELSDEEIRALWRASADLDSAETSIYTFARAVLAAAQGEGS